MREDVGAFWDERYRDREAIPERGPAAFLVENLSLLPASGTVLDVAMGTGRNALYLASHGFRVAGVDISPVAVERCRERAAELGLRIDAVCADLETYEMAAEAFDVVLNFYFLQRQLCPAMVRALRPRGVLVFETFTTDQRRFGWGPTQDDFLLRPGELEGLFPSLETLVLRQGITDSERGKKAVASLVARKRLEV